MKLDDFIAKHEGKKIDFDGAFGGQCVDLYRAYLKEVLGIPQSPKIKGAYEIWDTFDKKYFTATKNTPAGVPSRGDIVIWNSKAGRGFGHVAVFLHGNVHKFTSLDQNWPTLSKVTLTEHTYSHVTGWLEPQLFRLTLDRLLSISKSGTESK